MNKLTCLHLTFLALLLAMAACNSGSGGSESANSGSSGQGEQSRELAPIAVWAFPDGTTVSGQVHIGVVAYHRDTIASVDFTIAGRTTRISTESLNPATGEYEYIFSLNTISLAEDQSHSIQATARSSSGSSHTLPVLQVQVDNVSMANTLYVDSGTGNDNNGHGTAVQPFATIARALQAANSGDDIVLASGDYVLEVSSDFGFQKFVTIKPASGASPVITSVAGAIRSSFVKFQDLSFDFSATPATGPDGTIEGTMVAAYGSNHLWFSGCTFVGPANRYNNYLRALAFWGTAAHITVENCTFRHVDRMLVLGPGSPAIIRGNEAGPLTSDAFDINCSNVLISGNHIHHIEPPKVQISSRNLQPFDLRSNNSLNLHYCEFDNNDYETITISDIGSRAGDARLATAAEVAEALAADESFDALFTASASGGALTISPRRSNYKQHLYVSGPANDALGFSQQDQATEAVGAGQHADIFQAWSDIEQIVMRNNRAVDIHSQCFLSQGNTSDFAMINNLFDTSAWAFMFSEYEHHNMLIAHNTVWSSNSALIFRAGMPAPTSFVMQNNIFGVRHAAGDPSGSGYEADYNLYDLYNEHEFSMNSNSLETNTANSDPSTTPLFSAVTSSWDTERETWDYSGDFHLNASSPARDRGTTEILIPYDLDWHPRDASPDMGCYEYR